MAYSLEDRFPTRKGCFRLLDPGAYSYGCRKKPEPNRYPFLTNTIRQTGPCNKIYTDALYDTHIINKIPNCTSLRAKCPRFPYEAFSKEDLEALLCRCGLDKPCECPTEDEEQEEEIYCQARVRRRLFKGPPPRSNYSEGLSIPSKKDRGFEVLSDGSSKRLMYEILDQSPPFYDARLNEATAFYQGWKWSKWTSKRSVTSLDVRPGPADYTIIKKPTQSELCNEKVREHRRKTSKQLRFLEMIQQRDIREGAPGPATYDPELPKGTKLQSLGPKGERFPEYEVPKGPGPTAYWLKRNFDPPEIPDFPCQAKLPEPACFGVKAARFKHQEVTGPSPASYDAKYKPCQFRRCGKAPFGCSAKRFKDNFPEISDDDEIDEETEERNTCPASTWQFKANNTSRLKAIEKKYDEPSPADIILSKIPEKRSPLSQYIAPFYSSEGRFQPWYNWVAVHGRLSTPGPGTYCLDKFKCLTAVHRGPLYRARRFIDTRYQSPSPNEYKVGRGIECVLNTHNIKLKNNIKNQHKFHWQPPAEPMELTCKQRELALLDKAIAMLNTDSKRGKTSKSNEKIEPSETHKPISKLLRTFLYEKPVPHYF